MTGLNIKQDLISIVIDNNDLARYVLNIYVMTNKLHVVWLLPIIVIKLGKENLIIGSDGIIGIDVVTLLNVSSQPTQGTNVEAKA